MTKRLFVFSEKVENALRRISEQFFDSSDDFVYKTLRDDYVQSVWANRKFPHFHIKLVRLARFTHDGSDQFETDDIDELFKFLQSMHHRKFGDNATEKFTSFDFLWAAELGFLVSSDTPWYDPRPKPKRPAVSDYAIHRTEVSGDTPRSIAGTQFWRAMQGYSGPSRNGAGHELPSELFSIKFCEYHLPDKLRIDEIDSEIEKLWEAVIKLEKDISLLGDEQGGRKVRLKKVDKQIDKLHNVIKRTQKCIEMLFKERNDVLEGDSQYCERCRFLNVD